MDNILAAAIVTLLLVVIVALKFIPILAIGIILGKLAGLLTCSWSVLVWLGGVWVTALFGFLFLATLK